MGKMTGRVTIPSEVDFLEQTKELMNKWGADAIRDSDGTKLDQATKQLDAKIYETYFVARGHNEFAKNHMEECQQMVWMSKRNLAIDTTLKITFMEGYYQEQVIPDYIHNPKDWWEVIDRTTGQYVAIKDWDLNQEDNKVIIKNAIPFHEYTVNFLVYMIWDPTQMYNHITNNWGDKPHDIPFDVRMSNSGEYAKTYLAKWLQDNPDVDVVRFTTFFYHFTLVFNEQRKEKFVDWFGYGGTISVAALIAFRKEYGYTLKLEDIVDGGYYHTAFSNPTRQYLDYIDFIQRFVAGKAKELVDMVHASGKEAMMFLGDNWIGTEPYGKYFSEIGIDAVVGSVGGGATLRLISDIPHVKYTEGRFLPYFFPDTFYEGNDPCIEAKDNWLSARRAIMRKPVDRIGYGGYLHLPYQFPKFVDYIEQVTDEFRTIYDHVNGKKPYCGLKVAILNAWGKLRSWQTYMVAHALWYKQTYSYFGILEALSGMSVDVTFMSFDEVLEHGIPEDVDVIINAGDANTAFAGGEVWKNEKLQTTLRKWVFEGGGLIGVGEPLACLQNGKYFQLSDILGVEKELGLTLSEDKYFNTSLPEHFITADCTRDIDFGESMPDIYAIGESTEIIEYSNKEVHLAANHYGKGRGVYIAGLPYSIENTRLLLRACFYVANKEKSFHIWYADNLYCEVNAYPATGTYAVINNSKDAQQTTYYDGDGKAHTIGLKGSGIYWGNM